jgi:hypothetical protein
MPIKIKCVMKFIEVMEGQVLANVPLGRLGRRREESI